MKKAIRIIFSFGICNIKIILIWALVLLGVNMLQPAEIKVINAIIISIQKESSVFISAGLMLLFFFVIMIKEFQSSVNEILYIFVQNRISNYFFRLFVNNIKNISIIKYDNADFLLKIKRSRISIDNKIYQIIANVLQLAAGTMSIMVLSIMIANINKVFLGLFIVLFILQLIYTKKVTYANLKLCSIQDNDYRKHTYYNSLIRSRDYIKEIRISKCLNWIEKKRTQIYKKIEKEHLGFIRKWNLINAFWTILCTSIESLIFLTLIYGYTLGNFTIDEVILIIQSQEVIILSLISMVNTISLIREDMEYVKEFAECCENDDLDNIEIDEFVENSLIEIRNGFFGYPSGKQVLKNCSMEIKKGEKIMIVGKNGCGKTTLAKILLGLYKPTKGQIFFSKSKKDVVFQDFVKYKFTLRENIALGNITNLYDDEGIKQILNELALESLYQGKKGLEVFLGKEFEENSIDLSGGEWQKIAIGRALFNEDSDFVILDEPTSALDPIAELKEFKRICDYFSEKTVVLISHRVGLAKSVDKVVYMEDGKVCEIGTHEQLIKNRGKYYDFYISQAKWYFKSQ